MACRKFPQQMTMTTIKNSLLIAFFLIACNVSFAQHRDLGTWLGAGISYDLTKNISLDISEEMRYNISVADLYQLNSDISLSYKFTKKIKVGIDYRYSVRELADVNRVGCSLTLREGVKDFDFSIRSKIQYSFIPDRQEGSSWRNKGTIKYEVTKKLTPYFSAELFYAFSNDIDQFDNYRLETGLSWELNKHHELNPFFLYNQEFQVNAPEILNVFGLSYVYKN